MAKRVEGKTAIVVGGGQTPGQGIGNGRATAVVLGREGAHVCVVDRHLGSAQETADMIRAEGGQAWAHAADVTREAEVAALVAAARERFGRIDILHNNVGGQGTGRDLSSITVADWNATFARNITSAMLTCRAVVPVMERQGGGAIVNIASIAGIRHLNVPTAVYSATKGAMIEFTKNIAIEHARSGVRANCVLPGYIDTPFILRLVEGRPSYTYKGYATADEYRALATAKRLSVGGNSHDTQLSKELGQFKDAGRRPGSVRLHRTEIDGNWPDALGGDR